MPTGDLRTLLAFPHYPTTEYIFSSQVPVISIRLAMLAVPQPWTVGRVTFEPPSALAERIEKFSASGRGAATNADSQYLELLRTFAGMNEKWATAKVEVRSLDDDSLAEAIEAISEAINVLRLYRRARYPMVSFRRQDFGLPGEIVSDRMEYFWEEVDSEGQPTFPRHGGSRVGSLAPYEFSDADLEVWPSSKGFAFVDSGLKRRPNQRTDLERRFFSALRFWNQAQLAFSNAVKVVSVAICLEVLLRRERDDNHVHSLAQRATYLACYFGCGRTTALCPFQRMGAKELRLRIERGEYPDFCSAYGEIMRLFGDRNLVVHQGRDDFPSKEIDWHMTHSERILLGLIEWAGEHKQSSLKHLDHVLKTGGSLPAARQPASGTST